jgi:hypothetical protein
MASITAPACTAFDGKSPLLLPVPYFSQRDSATGQGDRMCFSTLPGAGAALWRHHQRPGPVAALDRLGIQATVRTYGRIEQLIAQLRHGFPIPVGWLHHGPVSAPRGGGT